MDRSNFKKNSVIFLFFLLSFVLVNYYRPIKVNYGYNDFGIADSGSGMISLIIVYLVVSRRKITYFESRNLAIAVFSIYFFQEVLSYFINSIGTFDFKDIIYYLLGFVFIYYFDVKGRKTKSFDNNILK